MDDEYYQLFQRVLALLQVKGIDLSSEDPDVVEEPEPPRRIELPPIPPLHLPVYPPPESMNRALNSRQG